MQRSNIDKARALRHNQTDAQKKLWRHLRARGLAGCTFRRQHPIGPFIVDLVCMDAMLIVELDGGQHTEQHARDASRTEMLESFGYRVVRFWNDDVLLRTEQVLEQVLIALQGAHPSPSAAPHPSPLPRGERGLVS